MPDSPSGDITGPSTRARSSSTSLPQSPGEAEPVLSKERRSSSSSTGMNVKEGERGDIINFYNKVIIISYHYHNIVLYWRLKLYVCKYVLKPLCIWR